MDEISKKRLEGKILELEVKLFLLSIQLDENFSTEAKKLLPSHSDLFKKEFDLLSFSVEQKNELFFRKIFDLIEDHLTSLKRSLTKFPKDGKPLGASGKADSGGVGR